MCRNVEPENLHDAGGGREQAGQHFYRRGFTRPIRTEEPVELARRNREIYFLDSREIPEAAGESSGDNRVHRISTLTQAVGRFSGVERRSLAPSDGVWRRR